MIAAQSLRDSYPLIEWDEPIKVTVGAVGQWFVCRICIARHGLKAAEIDATPFALIDREEAFEHVRSHSSETICTCCGAALPHTDVELDACLDGVK